MRRLPAGEIEAAVLDQIKGIRREPEVLSHTVREACSMEAGLDEADAINALRTIEEVWDELFPAQQSKIAHTLIQRITVRPDGVTIDLGGRGIEALLRVKWFFEPFATDPVRALANSDLPPSRSR